MDSIDGIKLCCPEPGGIGLIRLILLALSCETATMLNDALVGPPQLVSTATQSPMMAGADPEV